MASFRGIAALIVLSWLISSCGGGGGGATPTPDTSITISGVAATGGAISGATITVTDANGSVKTATADSDGFYSLSATGMTAPVVIVAEGQVGDSRETFVSISATLGTGIAGNTINVNPLTHAIASNLSSTGNPLDLQTNIATEKSNITATRISTAVDAFKTVLASIFTAAGLSATEQTSLHFISTPFKANGTGFDKVLDSIKVEVKPSGEIVMTSVGNALVDDTGTNGTTPSASTALVLSKGTLPVAGDVSKLPAPATGTTLLSVGDFQALRQQVNACFKLAAASRGTFSSPASACSGFAVSSYKHQGRTGSQEFNSLLADTTMDGSDFVPPELVRQLTSTRALVKLGFARTNGFLASIVTVVEKQASGSWLMVGNQRNFEVFVNAFVTRRESTTAAASQVTAQSRKDTGINIFVRNNSASFSQDANITAVKVFGPGLPGWVDPNNVGTGISLNKISGCDFWSIGSVNCSSLLRMQVFDLTTGGKVEFSSLPSGLQVFSLNPQLTDANVTTIQPDSPYRFDLTVTGTGTVTFWERLRSRPYKSDEVAKVTFLEIASANKTLVNSSSSSAFTGGSKLTFGWTNPANAAPAYTTAFFHAANSDFQNVKPSDRTVTVSCSSNSNCDSTVTSNYKSGLTAANFTASGATSQTRILQLIARNRYDTQVFTQVSN